MTSRVSEPPVSGPPPGCNMDRRRSSVPELVLTDHNVRAMRTEFNRHRTHNADKIPIRAVSRVCAAGTKLEPAELREIETEGNEGGFITFDRLLALMALQLQARQGTNFYRTVFNLIDTRGQGFLTFDQLRELIKTLDELTPEMQLTEKDVEDLVAAVKQNNKTDKVTFEDFYALMT